MNRLFIIGLGIALSAGVAQADIVVQNTAYNAVKLGGGTYTHTISGFDLSGGTKLVVTTGTENGNATGITFDGQALTSIVSVNNSSVQFASIWYLDNPTATSGNIVVTYVGAGAASGISALSVSGAELGVLDSAGTATANSGTLTINAGSLVVGSFTTNANTSSLINPDDPSTDIFSANIDSAMGGNAASAYFIEPDPAARTSFGFTGGDGRPVATAASFAVAVIPEPATLSMIGVIGFATLLRRRFVR